MNTNFRTFGQVLNNRSAVAIYRGIIIFHDLDGFWIGAHDPFDFGVQPNFESCEALIEGFE